MVFYENPTQTGMTSSTDYVEAVQQMSFIAGRVCFFLTKIVQSGAQHNVGRCE